ncbi:MAG: hypothetical protein IJQ23_01155 [Clostridia bacterium]|nr:hypothetical protein [Clostridia bacterium]
MNYRNAKIYFDGSHYIAIPQGAFPSGKGKKTTTATRKQTTKEQHFETTYKDSLSKPKKERKKAIKEALQDEFDDSEDLTAFVNANLVRVKTNAIKRKVRLMRKLRLQD